MNSSTNDVLRGLGIPPLDGISPASNLGPEIVQKVEEALHGYLATLPRRPSVGDREAFLAIIEDFAFLLLDKEKLEDLSTKILSVIPEDLKRSVELAKSIHKRLSTPYETKVVWEGSQRVVLLPSGDFAVHMKTTNRALGSQWVEADFPLPVLAEAALDLSGRKLEGPPHVLSEAYLYAEEIPSERVGRQGTHTVREGLYRLIYRGNSYYVEKKTYGTFGGEEVWFDASAGETYATLRQVLLSLTDNLYSSSPES